MLIIEEVTLQYKQIKFLFKHTAILFLEMIFIKTFQLRSKKSIF